VTRAAIVEWALAQVGPTSHDKRCEYWASALGKPVTFAEIQGKAWCGAFALAALHAGGVATDEHWKWGAGFLLQNPHPLHQTKTPLPGDIGYQGQPFAHHFLVQSVDGSIVHTVEGNTPDVKRASRVMSPAVVYFSIAPLLAAAGAADILPAVGPQLRQPVSPAAVQHATNSLICKHLLDIGVPNLLTVDGIIGVKSEAAIRWAQGVLRLPQTGNPDDATCKGLGLT